MAYHSRTGVQRGARLFHANRGDKYNHLTVVEELPRDGKKRMVRFMCDCGTETDKQFDLVHRGHTKSCGCYKRSLASTRGKARALDLTGQTAGFLTYVSEADRDPKRRERVILCRCACGNTIKVKANSFLSGNTKSCGCFHRMGAKQKLAVLNSAATANRKDLSGQLVGRYKVIERDESEPRRPKWKLQCTSCGDFRVARQEKVKSGVGLPYCTCTPFVAPVLRGFDTSRKRDRLTSE